MRLLIGVDGGGTKTDYVACDMHGNVMGRLSGGETNPIDIGTDTAVRLLSREIRRLAGDGDIASIYCGLSGGTTGSNREEIHKGLRASFGGSVILENGTDAMNLLTCEFGSGDGCAVIAGTGAVGYGRKSGGIVQVGGYGALFDMGGSGYDFGRDAIGFALRSLDGRGEGTLITKLLEEKAGDIRMHLPVFYERGKKYIASFAPLVFKAYRAGDAAAAEIVDRNAAALSEIVNALARYLETDTCRVALAGSIFREFDLLCPHMKKYIDHRAVFLRSVYPPVLGAVLQAAINMGVKDIKAFKENLARTLA